MTAGDRVAKRLSEIGGTDEDGVHAGHSGDLCGLGHALHRLNLDNMHRIAVAFARQVRTLLKP